MKQFRFVRKAVIMTFGVQQMVACSNGGKSGDDAPARGKIESAFYNASAESGVPVRLIMAVGFVESGLRPDHSSALYLGADKSASSPSSIDFGDTAFGLSSGELNLVGSGKSDSLETQVQAYGKFLKEKFKDIKLPPNAVTPEEKIRWIWKLAEVHHGGDQQHRNLWAVFAHEMIATLNKGFAVRDVDSGEVITLEKEPAAIKEDQLPQNIQMDLNLDSYIYNGDITNASLFSLTSSQAPDVENHPKHIEVIHCPFSLTVCLDLQQRKSDSGARLGAHYVIPADQALAPGILQLARHVEAVELTDVKGNLEIVSDRIVVMLAGNSGRYVNGIRNYVNPLWLTDYQLRLMGFAVDAICNKLKRTEGIDPAVCKTPGVTGGVMFRNQPGVNFRWGDIADYDESIFYPYVLNAGAGALGATTIETSDGRTVYDAGSQFSLLVKFQAGARRVEIERLIRCGNSDHHIVWEPGGYPQVRADATSLAFNETWDDAGPNANGDQFFRAKVFGEGTKFLGWAVQQVQLRNVKPDADSSEAVSKYCLRNGS